MDDRFPLRLSAQALHACWICDRAIERRLALDVTESEIAASMRHRYATRHPPSEQIVREAIAEATGFVQLDAADESTQAGHEHPYDAAEEAAVVVADLEVVTARIRALSANERLKEMFLLRLSGPHTLEEVGQVFGVTREAVRQAQVRVYAKLVTKHPDTPPIEAVLRLGAAAAELREVIGGLREGAAGPDLRARVVDRWSVGPEVRVARARKGKRAPRAVVGTEDGSRRALERELVGLVLEVGLLRAEAVLAELRRTAGAVAAA